MKAEPITVSQLKEMVDTPAEIMVFRQTRNWRLRRWNCVQRRLDNGKWRRIRDNLRVINKQGWAYALWRVSNVITEKLDIYNRPIWQVNMFKIRHGVYMTYYLVCKRAHHSIQGVF